MSKKISISPAQQYNLFKNHDLLTNRKLHGFCMNCSLYDIKTLDFKNKTQSINCDNLEIIKKSLHELALSIKSFENNNNKYNPKNRIDFSTIDDYDCNQLSGLEKHEIQKISDICGIYID